MTTAQSRRGGRFVGLIGMFAGLVFGLLSAAAPDRTATAAPRAQKDDKKYPKPAEGAFELYGASNCKTCHNQQDPKGEQEYKDTRGYEFVRLRENRVWSAHDLHRTAYQNLLTSETKVVKEGQKDENDKKIEANPTAERMEKNLRAAGTDPKYKAPGYLVSTDTQCLACHASVTTPIADAPPKNWKLDSFATDEGVGCEMCHGHGSKYAEEHKRNKLAKGDGPPDAKRVVPWREFPVTVKKEWGMANLRNPVEATARCASCHIGNVEEGRFVTHDMYAAGHPPLPPLDLIAYTREQPRHWGWPTDPDLKYFEYLRKEKPQVAESVFYLREGESHVARRFVESTVATLKASAALGGQLADAPQAKIEGLDYAAFDCASCHHNLKYPSDRQDRGYLGKPGRPLYRPATFALTKVVIAHAATLKGGDDLKASLDELYAAEKLLADAFTERSMGDPEKVKTATKKVSDWCDTALKKLVAVRYDNAAVQGLLAKLTEVAKQEPKDKDPRKRAVADPEVAQLFSWAAETLLLDQLPPSKDKDPLGQPKPPAEVEALRKSLDGIVVTRLRPKAPFHYEVPGGVPGPNLEAVDTRIGDRMKIFNSFQGEPFRKTFGALNPTFPK
jgi:hypothetical protein